MRQFQIDPSYLVTITCTRTTSFVVDPENPTPEELIMVLRNEHQMTSHWVEDHPEFTKLRNELEQLGYIKTERSWWNGDRVLQPFVLNNVLFHTADKFVSASPMKYHLAYELSKYKVDISL